MQAQEGLEAAVAVVMGERDAGHVEGRGVGRNIVRIVDEHELGARVDEPADQPGAARPVDMAASSCRPSHETASSESPSASTADRACSAIGAGEVVARADPPQLAAEAGHRPPASGLGFAEPPRAPRR